MKEIIFHLGDRKTGSTSIQNMLAAGGWECAGVRLNYPAKANHISLASSLAEGVNPRRRKKLFIKLSDRIANTDADVFVISAEFFESVDPSALQDAIETYFSEWRDQIRLVAYVRPHADRMLSSYAERMKQGLFTGSLEQMVRHAIRRNRFEYTPRFQKWRATFGDQFTLRPMIRSELHQGDVVADFMNFALKGSAFRITYKQASNESLSVEDLAMLRVFHTLIQRSPSLKIENAKNTVGWALARILNRLPRERKTRLAFSSKLFRRVENAYQQDAASLDEAFFVGTPMSDALADMKARTISDLQSLDPNVVFTTDEYRILRSWAALVIDMMGSKTVEIRRHLRDLPVAGAVLDEDPKSAANTGSE